MKPTCPAARAFAGDKLVDNRRFVNAVLWILRTGAPWRDLSPDYGDWKNIHRRFSRWRDKGIWTQLMHTLAGEHDMEWLMVDVTHIKIHPHGAAGGSQGMSRTKGG